MDYENQPGSGMSDKAIRAMRSQQAFATASLAFGVIALVCICCIYITIVCGALSIIFAVLSKNAENMYSRPAKTGIRLSVIGMILSVIMLAVTIGLEVRNAGGIDSFIQKYEKNI
jgi:Na+/proline symporter